jgi:hypothetical protein
MGDETLLFHMLPEKQDGIISLHEKRMYGQGDKFHHP